MAKKENAITRCFGEFKTFITRGNVLDMSVGVIVGGAFTGIVNGLSNFLLKPFINWLLSLVLPGEGLLRVSFGHQNTEKEVETLLSALQVVCRD